MRRNDSRREIGRRGDELVDTNLGTQRRKAAGTSATKGIFLARERENQREEGIWNGSRWRGTVAEQCRVVWRGAVAGKTHRHRGDDAWEQQRKKDEKEEEKGAGPEERSGLDPDGRKIGLGSVEIRKKFDLQFLEGDH